MSAASLRYRPGNGVDALDVFIGEQPWVIPRLPREQTREIDDNEPADDCDPKPR